ncbi:gamma-glutamyl-gamma-aminobutyrate hydrolase family protein [Microbacterium sp. NIBRBAC000506063]|nr:gamma-glutamyl-gamma-aminobutyrate hydrolase family protein [Microbacterium sp. NIBRBAC000506063]
MQVANIAFGGTLIVDIAASAAHRPVRGAAQLDERHPISLDPVSRLARTYGVTERIVNTIHHQAVGTLAPGFRAVAWAPDGIIEAIEPDGEWPFWGVQWHPEKMAQPAEAAQEQPLYAAFLAAARQRAAGSPPQRKEQNEQADLPRVRERHPCRSDLDGGPRPRDLQSAVGRSGEAGHDAGPARHLRRTRGHGRPSRGSAEL